MPSQRNPDHGEAYHNLGGLLQDTDRSMEALSMFQRALELRPYDGESYRRVGAVLYSLGRVEEATAIYKRWVELRAQQPAGAATCWPPAPGSDVPARASDAFVKNTFDRSPAASTRSSRS